MIIRHERNARRTHRVAMAALLSGGATFFLSNAAFAQEAGAPDTAGTQVGDIIVTATKRSESMQKVPVAVSAFSGEAIAETRITGLADLAAAVPGPTFVPISGASGSQMMIRGQYASDDSPAFDTPVGVFIDDIYYGSVASFYPDFYDVEQVAVLRGPQGTTFGRNTVGGALQIVSNKPTTEEFSGEVSGTIRNLDGFESTGFLNAPIGDKLAARFAYSYKDVGGDIENVTTGNDVNDKNVWSARGSLLWEAAPNFDVVASIQYTEEDSLGDGPFLVGQGALIASLNNTVDSGKTYLDDDGKTQREILNTYVRADWDLGWATATSITGWRTLDSFYLEDIDGSPVRIAPNKIDINEEEQFSQEFRLTSPDNQTIEWIAGLYYLDQSVFRSETYTFGADPSTYIFGSPWRISTITGGTINRVLISGDIETMSIAPFGEAKWNINDQWAITGGVRYTYDEKKNRTYQQNLTSPGSSTIFFGLPKDVEVEESWDAWTPRVVLDYQPNDDLFLYASLSRGFKSGGFNYAAATLAQAITPILPETSTSYEIGAKSYWFDRALRVNFAAYQTQTEDLQVRSLVGTTLQTNNAGEAEVKGVELEVLAMPIDGLSLGLNYAYTDATYKSYPGCAGTAVTPINCTGNKIPFVPANSLNISAEYEWALANDSTLTLRVEDKWTSNYEVHIQNNTPGTPTAARDMTGKNNIINAFLTFDAPGDKWSVQAWGRNLLDKRSVTFATNYFFYLLTQSEVSAGLNEANRTSVSEGISYGLTASYRF